MSTTSPPIGGPFLKKSLTVQQIMMVVMLALAPATLYGLFTFGWPAVYLFAVTVGSAVVFEAVWLKMAGRPIAPALSDGSAALTGWLLAMTLPPWAPWWIGVLGSLIAIWLGKQVFGGVGQNLFNPAMVARVVLLISFPVHMTLFVDPSLVLNTGAPGLKDSLAVTFGVGAPPAMDTVSSASVLGHLKTEVGRGNEWLQVFNNTYDMQNVLWGAVPGSLGETSAPLILLGGLLLLGLRIISWHIPVAMIGTLAVMATIFNFIDPMAYPGAAIHVLSGATLLGAFFIATDLVTSPVSPLGKLVFGFGCGLLVYVIRTWAGYPEGLAFAVLIMNAATPLIDRYTRPRVYGRDRKGEPLATEEGAK